MFEGPVVGIREKKTHTHVVAFCCQFLWFFFCCARVRYLVWLRPNLCYSLPRTIRINIARVKQKKTFYSSMSFFPQFSEQLERSEMKTLSPGRDDKYLRCPSKHHVPIVSKLSRSFLLLFDKSKLFCNAISWWA